MARARNIKPGLMENETLAELSHGHRLLFIYLWMLADREGRIEDRPKRIKGQAFPYDGEMDIDGMLHDLAKAGFIHRYDSAGVSAIQVLNFAKHQTPHIREKASTLPSPELEPAEGVASTDQGSAEHQPSQCHGIAKIAGFSDSLIPDSLIGDEDQKPLGDSGESPADDDGDQPGNQHDDEQPAQPAKAYSDDFEAFWREYPRRHRASPKPDAWKNWRARIKAGVPAQDLITAAINYQIEQEALGKVGTEYVKQPATFLGKGEHWIPYLTEQPPPTPPSASRSAVLTVPTHTQEMYPDDRF
ncbi:phage replication protein [Pseudomonas bohemica]|uniref:phage replication protein n=1 Tax=Pseudomonas bohemica TaxID=2044872 RepID=UPI000DA62581|nr:phage replication protein [Pseudomonas bohemica]